MVRGIAAVRVGYHLRPPVFFQLVPAKSEKARPLLPLRAATRDLGEVIAMALEYDLLGRGRKR
jgi:hypothetical protein